MASNTAVASMSNKELLDIIKKDSTDRLCSEMKVAQSYFSYIEVNNMSHAELISHVLFLRKLAGQTNSLKTLIPGFKPTSKIDHRGFQIGDMQEPAKEVLDITTLVLMMETQAQAAAQQAQTITQQMQEKA